MGVSARSPSHSWPSRTVGIARYPGKIGNSVVIAFSSGKLNKDTKLEDPQESFKPVAPPFPLHTLDLIIGTETQNLCPEKIALALDTFFAPSLQINLKPPLSRYDKDGFKLWKEAVRAERLSRILAKQGSTPVGYKQIHRNGSAESQALNLPSEV